MEPAQCPASSLSGAPMIRNRNSNQWHWRAHSIAWTLFFSLVVYPVSIAPSLWLCESAGFGPRHRVHRTIELVYAPIYYAHRHGPPLVREAVEALFSTVS